MDVEFVIFLCFLLILALFLVVINTTTNHILPDYEENNEYNPFIGVWTNDDIDTVYYFDEENFSYHKKHNHSDIHKCKYTVEDGVIATVGNVGLVTVYLIDLNHIRLCLKGLNDIDLYRQG
jgi:hypothetical protein